MSFQVDLNSTDFDDIDKHYHSSYSNTATTKNCCHEVIFSPPNRASLFIESINLKEKPSMIDCRVQSIVQNHGIKPIGTVSGEVGISASWGGDKGAEFSGYVSGSASDDNGNTVEVSVEVNSDGSGNASASASHEEKTDS